MSTTYSPPYIGFDEPKKEVPQAIERMPKSVPVLPAEEDGATRLVIRHLCEEVEKLHFELHREIVKRQMNEVEAKSLAAFLKQCALISCFVFSLVQLVSILVRWVIQ